jgi:hypothetical protein
VEETVNKLIITGIGIAAAALLALGCGNTGEGTATAQSPKAQFVKQANGVCSEAKREMKAKAAAWEKAHGGKVMDWDTAWKQVLLPSLRHEAADLNALKVPLDLEDDKAQMVKTLSKGMVAYAKEGDPSGFNQFKVEARASGLGVCAS